jgi:hypothetical protein
MRRGTLSHHRSFVGAEEELFPSSGESSLSSSSSALSGVQTPGDPSLEMTLFVGDLANVTDAALLTAFSGFPIR